MPHTIAPSLLSARPFCANVRSTNIAELDAHMATRSYVDGVAPTQKDVSVFKAIAEPGEKFSNAQRWYLHIKSFSASKVATFPGAFETLAASAAAPPAAPAKEEKPKQEKKEKAPKEDKKKVGDPSAVGLLWPSLTIPWLVARSGATCARAMPALRHRACALRSARV